ncbi:CDP-alcohol phosphatidyltransferase family protein [Planomonospora sp. ID67723]|uniref:CDP-alcohol phosphatidyltransferase family protein n=1 Tax=Planomonospora sp. ID67723 TaxID=2738134 RepID=UPI0027DCB872|nr:CDP-alcohol phosphatidyltransferase family protein [Planomonospora sp. ID67723]
MLATTAAARLRCPDGTLLDRLTGQLSAFPVREVHVLTRAGDVVRDADGSYLIGSDGSRGISDDLRRVARVARGADGPVAVLAGDLVAHTEALAGLLDHPAYGTGAVVDCSPEGGGVPGPLRPPVRVENGRVAAAGTFLHRVRQANGTFRGALQVGEDDLGDLAETAERLAGLVEAGRLGPVDGVEAGDLLLAGLVRAGVPVRVAELGRLHCDRVAGQGAADAALARVAEVDVNRVWLDAAVKTDDGFFATYFVSSWSRYLVTLAAWLRLTPNAVTGISTGLAVLSAVWFSAGTRAEMVAGAVLLYLSFVLDCVDGQLARYTRTFSPLGSWLDATSDRVKEYTVYAGLAFGHTAVAGRQGADDWGVWPLAVAALILQALRHMIDFSYAGAREDAGGARAVRSGAAAPAARPGAGGPLIPAQAPSREEPGVRFPESSGTGPGSPRTEESGAVVRLSRRLERGALTRWFKKIVILPIGERMALIAVTAAVADARVTFIALLGWGGLAALYTLAGRMGRSMA